MQLHIKDSASLQSESQFSSEEEDDAFGNFLVTSSWAFHKQPGKNLEEDASNQDIPTVHWVCDIEIESELKWSSSLWLYILSALFLIHWKT